MTPNRLDVRIFGVLSLVALYLMIVTFEMKDTKPICWLIRTTEDWAVFCYWLPAAIWGAARLAEGKRELALFALLPFVSMLWASKHETYVVHVVIASLLVVYWMLVMLVYLPCRFAVPAAVLLFVYVNVANVVDLTMGHFFVSFAPLLPAAALVFLPA